MNQLKDISSFSDEELISITKNSSETAAVIRELFQASIGEIKYQLGLIDRYFSGFSQRSGTMMTVAGLISFLPAFMDFESFYIKHFYCGRFHF